MSKDVLYDILENIHEVQGFGKKIYIDRDNLSITSTYDDVEDNNLVYLGIPVSDEEYDKMLMNYDDSYIDINNSYLEGETKSLYESLTKYCEVGLTEFKGILEDSDIDTPEKVIEIFSDLSDYIPDDAPEEIKVKFQEFSEVVEEKVREIKDYIVSDEICESINSFSSYSGRWESIKQYKDFLDSEDSLDLRELNKIISIYVFNQSKDSDQFDRDFSDNDDLDTEAILDHFKDAELSKDQLRILTDIQFYFNNYPNDYDYLNKLIPLLTSDERLELINNNRFISINSLMEYGFEPANEEEALSIVEQNGKLLYDIRFDFDDNDKVVMAAIKDSGYALEYASDRLRDDLVMVLEAVKNTGHCLEYASDRIKDNPMVVLEAVIENKNAINYASDRIKELCKSNTEDLERALENIVLNDKLIIDLNNQELVKTKKAKI